MDKVSKQIEKFSLCEGIVAHLGASNHVDAKFLFDKLVNLVGLQEAEQTLGHEVAQQVQQQPMKITDFDIDHVFYPQGSSNSGYATVTQGNQWVTFGIYRQYDDVKIEVSDSSDSDEISDEFIQAAENLVRQEIDDTVQSWKR